MSKNYCKKIADTISMYRWHDRNNGVLQIDIDEAHVQRWISQFDSNQDIILSETANLLDTYYFSKDNIEEILASLYSSPKIWGENIPISISNSWFLDCQTKGNSQHKLYKKSRKIIFNQFGIDIDEKNSNPNTFVYIDDCMFSGSTVLKDLNRLLDDVPRGSKVIALFIVVHSFAEWWVKQNLSEKLKQKNVELEIWRCKTVQNSGGRNHTYECLWPKAYSSPNVNAYLETIQWEHELTPEKKVRQFREDCYSGGPYTSEVNRVVLEQALMEAGLRIRSFSQNPQPYMRPMGYDNRISFGFGAFFATYMNMSNNCPLAFWWGDCNAPSWHPFSKWYPLLPRKANEQGGDMIAW